MISEFEEERERAGDGGEGKRECASKFVSLSECKDSVELTDSRFVLELGGTNSQPPFSSPFSFSLSSSSSRTSIDVKPLFSLLLSLTHRLSRSHALFRGSPLL